MDRTKQHKKRLSSQVQFLIMPLFIVVLTAVVLNASQDINESQQKLLRSIEQETLPQSIELTHLVVQLTQTFRDCNQLLGSTQGHPDEESIYLHGKVIVNQLHRIEKKAEQLFKRFNNQKLSDQFSQLFFIYQEQVMSAIEMASVDLSLAATKLDQAHDVIEKMDKNIEQLLLGSNDLIKTSVNQQLSLLEKERVALMALWFGLVLLAVGSYVLARYFSRVITLSKKEVKFFQARFFC